MWDRLDGFQRLEHLIISQIGRRALKTQQRILQGGAWDPHRRKVLPKGTEGHIWNVIFLSLSLSFWTAGGPSFSDSSEAKTDLHKSTQQSSSGNFRAACIKAAAGAPVSPLSQVTRRRRDSPLLFSIWAFQECLSRAGSRLSGGNQAFLPGAPFPSSAWLPGPGILLMGDKAFNSKRSDERLQKQMCGQGSRLDNRRPSK